VDQCLFVGSLTRQVYFPMLCVGSTTMLREHFLASIRKELVVMARGGKCLIGVLSRTADV